MTTTLRLLLRGSEQISLETEISLESFLFFYFCFSPKAPRYTRTLFTETKKKKKPMKKEPRGSEDHHGHCDWQAGAAKTPPASHRTSRVCVGGGVTSTTSKNRAQSLPLLAQRLFNTAHVHRQSQYEGGVVTCDSRRDQQHCNRED